MKNLKANYNFEKMYSDNPIRDAQEHFASEPEDYEHDFKCAYFKCEKGFDKTFLEIINN